MSSSDEDRPLAKMNGGAHRNHSSSTSSADTNGTTPVPILPEKIPKALDRKLDRGSRRMEIDPASTAGISIANGQVKKIEIKKDGTNGAKLIKRKNKKPTVKEEAIADDSDTPMNKRRKPNGTKKPIVVGSSDDDVPLAKKVSPSKLKKPVSKIITKKPPALMGQDNSSDSDIPLATQKLAKEKNKIQKEASKIAKEIRAEDKKTTISRAKRKMPIKDESDSDVQAKPKKRASTTKKASVVKKEESSDDDIPLAKKAKTTKATAKKEVKKDAKKDVKKDAKKKKDVDTKVTAKGKAKAKKEESPDEVDEDEEAYKWWENQPETDGTKKWTTLEHNGVLFPPQYEPLPKNVKMKYNGVDITLPIEAEEVAGFFGAMIDSSHAQNPKFVSNFFKDFTVILQEAGGARNSEGKKVKIEVFEKCDFTAMFDYFELKKNEKKLLNAAEKKAIKAEKEKAEEKYQYCLLDGRKEKVGNFRMEPPGLFRGRGDHPKTGMVKKRVPPESVTINIGLGVTVPAPPAGHQWADVIHDNTVTWLATWKENINGNIKYVMLAANSSLKGMSDFKKFEKARELKKHIDRIRKDYTRELKSELMADRQRATAMYLIDQFALRAGNEKSTDEEADTVGCCSLRYEHVTLEQPNYVIFDFLGKDSIRFYQKVCVEPQVFRNLKIFKKAPKTNGDMIFDRLDTTQLNKHLQNYMPGLSAKVFRTYNASWTMQQQLKTIPNEGTVHDKYAAYTEANRKVAILCNHQRTVSAAHDQQMEKVVEKIKALRYQKLRAKRQILFLDPKQKKRDPDFFKPDAEIDDDWIKQHQESIIEVEDQKIRKKFEKENEKLAETGQAEQKEDILNERLSVLQELKDEFKQENTTGKLETKARGVSVEKLLGTIEKIDERIRKQETDAKVKEDNKTVALGTSKINYIDPRLTVMFCKKFNVPIEKPFTKALRDKFKWALESADENWEF